MTPDAFRTIRRSLKLTQAQMADILGYGAAMRISELETGRRAIQTPVGLVMQALADGWRPPAWPVTPDEGKTRADAPSMAEGEPKADLASLLPKPRAERAVSQGSEGKEPGTTTAPSSVASKWFRS